MLDRWANYLTPNNIEYAVARVFKETGVKRGSYFDITKFIEVDLCKYIRSGFEIKLYNGNENGEPLAKVSYSPLTLWVDTDIWEEAKLGEPNARYILAHEIGHLVLHNHYTVNFSTETHNSKGAIPEDRSAERQAHIFACLFFFDAGSLSQQGNNVDLAIKLGVPRSAVDARMSYCALRNEIHIDSIVELSGDSCGECGNFTLVRNGTCLKCDTCGSTTGYS